jgi:putative transposase
MKQRRFSDEQIIAIVKEQDAGTKTTDVCQKCGISDATFHKLEEKYGGLEISEARRLKPLEGDNAAPYEIAGKTGDT